MRSSPTKQATPKKIPRIIHADEHGLFFGLLKTYHVPLPETEVTFAGDAGRRWRFDFAWDGCSENPASALLPRRRVAVEVEGGAWTQGRHTRGKGFIADMEKYNEAAIRGWRVLRVTPQQLCTLDTITLIKRALNG